MIGSLILSITLMGSATLSTEDASNMKCQSTKLVAYKVVLSTFWNQQNFPRQYPEWRPPAQWSKVVGFSHRPEYKLFRLGDVASPAVKEFAELGSTEVLDKQTSNQHGLNQEGGVILDGFNAPPIEKGEGTTWANLFLDGNHTRVSLLSRMIPSPDWFVGLDSLNLCENGHFVDTVTVEADPLDAGTDNGFTFTSPNWPTSPPATIFRITNKYPSHPASSFYYPEKSSLPTVATFTFIKEKEYELSEVFDLKHNLEDAIALPMMDVNKYAYEVENEEKDALLTFVSKSERTTTSTTSSTTSTTTTEMSNDISDVANAASIIFKSPVKSFRSGYHASSGPTDFLKKRYKSNFVEEATDKLYDDDSDGGNLYRKLLDTYKSRRKMGLSKDLTKRLRRKRLRKLRHHRKPHKNRKPRNCKVGEWSEWSSCSKSCGIGESVRTRKIIRKPKRGGNPCPPLKSMSWCGSARNCPGKYFDW